jgi:hypothetical protein
MKETGSAALALTAALITSSTFLPRACSSMYSWMLMLSFGEDRIGAVRRLVRRVVMGARRAVGAEKAAEALIMNAAYEQSPKEKRKKVFFAFFYPEAAVRDLARVFRIFTEAARPPLSGGRRKSIRLAPLVQHTRSTPASETHHGEAPEDREDPRPIRCGRHAHHSPQGASRTPRGRFLARPRDDARHDVAHLPRSASAARARRRP